MWSIKDISRSCKRRIIERLCDTLLMSGHFRRTMLRRLFQSHVSPNALAYVMFPDHTLIVDPRDHMIAFSLMTGKTWQRNEFDRAIEIACAANAMTNGGWFLDIGANIGTQTIYAMLSGRFRGVIAIEPEPRNIGLLRRNIELNGLTDRVHIIEAAAGAANGTADLIRDAENFGGHSIDPGQPLKRADSIKVRTCTIDSVLAGLDIPASDVSMAFVDVEGYEFEVLKGMGNVLQHGAPIVVEVSASRDGRRGVEQLRSLLSPAYSMIAPLNDRELTRARAPGGDLATFDFGLRHIDVLFYNAQSTAHCKAG